MRQRSTFVNPNKNEGNRNNPYSRNFGQNYPQDAGTYVPGMHEEASGANNDFEETQNDAPVVGFLYSISRKGIGEFWPLHLGTNTIGRAGDCDIRLQEMSVSEHHASISIKQMKSSHKMIASIRDIGSKNGIYLNDEELDYENHSCKSNDLILIGHCYQLLLLLIDAEQYGLHISEDFVPADDQSFDNMGHNFTNPYSSSERKVETGTVDLSGVQFEDPGNTNFL